MRRLIIAVCGLVTALALARGASVAATDDETDHARQPELLEVVLAGRAQQVERVPTANRPAGGELVYRALSITPRDFPLELKVGSVAEHKHPVIRLMTQLQGRDTDWADHDAMMWLVLRFLDEGNRVVSSTSFIRRGTSPGWAGVPQRSRFNAMTETAVVPERARKLQLLFVSGGTPRTTGFWAIRRLQVSGATPGGDFTPLFALTGLHGTALESPRGNPEGWVRDGTNLRTPQLFNPGGPRSEPMLALVDVDPNDTGGWLRDVRQAVPVEPGLRLRVDSEELYSVGRGADANVVYRTLPFGKYVFRARAADEFGRPSGPALELPVEIVPPFYQTSGFRILLVTIAVIALLAVVRYLSWRKMQREVNRLERSRAIEQERTRIARDIHDEMGSRLTQISLLAARALPTLSERDPAHAPVRQIHGAVRELATALDEIVWAANPTLDSLDGLGNYLSKYAEGVTRDAGVRCRLDIPAILLPRPMSSGTRHRLMMAVKEALTNALKHAHADEVRVRLALEGDVLDVSVEDDGIGFDVEKAPCGNGLTNMRQRLQEAGGSCTVKSTVGRGTCVTIVLPLPPGEEDGS